MPASGPLKVLHVIHSLHTGGAEQVVKNYALHFDSRRFRVTVCALTSGGDIVADLRHAGIKVHLLDKSRRWDFSVLPKLAAVIRAESPDLIHVHDDMSNNWTLLALVFKRRVPVIRTMHNPYQPAPSLYYRLHQIFSRPLYRYNHCLTCCSEAVRQSLRLDSASCRNLITIHNGIDINAFTRAKGNSTKASDSQVNGTDGYRLGTIGGLRAEKGHRYLLQAAQILMQQNYPVHFYFVGEGDNRPALEQLAQQLKVQSMIHFLGYRSDVQRLLEEFDLVIFPSISEGLPIAVLESLIMKKPVIATRVGGIPEIIEHGKTGWLVPPADAAALADAIAEALSDPEERQRRAAQGFRQVVAEFVLETMISKTEAIYEEILRGHRPRHRSLTSREKEIARACVA